MKSPIFSLLKGIKSLFWFGIRLFGRKRKPRVRKLTKKQKVYTWNFSSGRLKNVSFRSKDKQIKNKSKRNGSQRSRNFSKKSVVRNR